MAGQDRGSAPPIGRSLYSHAVLVDTGAFLAQVSARDVHHQDSLECFQALARKRLHLYASIPTVHEAFRRILYDVGKPAAWRFLDAVLAGGINIIRTVDDDEREGSRLLRRYGSQSLTLTDATNMAAMIRLGIAAAFSFDSHFLLAGFVRIPPLHVA
jgi:predicted nucleic acid-binding protein